MEFPFGETVVRERRKLIPDPYNPDSLTPGTWDDELDVVDLEGAAVLSMSSNATGDSSRTQTLTSKALYLSDPDSDVENGDRIRVGELVYYIKARPEADTNPFTGWRPTAEIPLDLTEG